MFDDIKRRVCTQVAPQMDSDEIIEVKVENVRLENEPTKTQSS